MNVAFFLTPKSEVVWIPAHVSMRAAIDQMNRSGFSAVPLLDDRGSYIGTITEGDFLRKLASTPNLSISNCERIGLLDVPMRTNVRAVGIDAEMEELFSRALEQNFVPVVDSRGVFIGIVRRRAIIEYTAGLVRNAARKTS